MTVPDLSRLTDGELIAYIGGYFDQADPVPSGAVPCSLAEAEQILMEREVTQAHTRLLELYALPAADDKLLLSQPPFPLPDTTGARR